MLEIASGVRRHRYLGDEYRALVQLLDRTEGKPKERVEHSGDVTHRVVIEESGDGVA